MTADRYAEVFADAGGEGVGLLHQQSRWFDEASAVQLSSSPGRWPEEPRVRAALQLLPIERDEPPLSRTVAH